MNEYNYDQEPIVFNGTGAPRKEKPVKSKKSNNGNRGNDKQTILLVITILVLAILLATYVVKDFFRKNNAKAEQNQPVQTAEEIITGNGSDTIIRYVEAVNARDFEKMAASYLSPIKETVKSYILSGEEVANEQEYWSKLEDFLGQGYTLSYVIDDKTVVAKEFYSYYQDEINKAYGVNLTFQNLIIYTCSQTYASQDNVINMSALFYVAKVNDEWGIINIEYYKEDNSEEDNFEEATPTDMSISTETTQEVITEEQLTEQEVQQELPQEQPDDTELPNMESIPSEAE